MNTLAGGGRTGVERSIELGEIKAGKGVRSEIIQRGSGQEGGG